MMYAFGVEIFMKLLSIEFFNFIFETQHINAFLFDILNNEYTKCIMKVE